VTLLRRVVLLSAVLALAGCGGGEGLDAGEPAGTFKVEVVDASFPKLQRIAESVQLKLRVRNADQRTLKDVAVTVETKATDANSPAAFGLRSLNSNQSDSTRPIWVLDRGPKGGDTAYVNTWSAGTMAAGETRELTWQLVAVKAGTYTIDYRVAPGLAGRARAAQGHTSGSFSVTIKDEPVPARVGGDGQVVRGSEPGSR
jgi:hypothetical protein